MGSEAGNYAVDALVISLRLTNRPHSAGLVWPFTSCLLGRMLRSNAPLSQLINLSKFVIFMCYISFY